VEATETTEAEHAGASTSCVEEVGVSERAATQRPSHVFQTKRRTRVLNRKSGTGRSTTLRLFPLEAQELSPKVVSPVGAGAVLAPGVSMEIVPYAAPMDVDENGDDFGGEDYCSSPDAGFAGDAFGSPVPMTGEGFEEDVVEGQFAEAAQGPSQEPLASAAKKPLRSPHQRLKKHLKNRKSLAPHGLKTHEETGLRRSTRRKVKPLHYWRNEKVEYGREHRSLATIVSISLRSPDEFWPAPDKRKPKTRSRIKDLQEGAVASGD